MIKIIYNTLCSIAFLQEANVLHRDIKPANLLIDQNYDVKICDFGLSRSAPSGITDSKFTSTRMREKLVGTPLINTNEKKDDAKPAGKMRKTKFLNINVEEHKDYEEAAKIASELNDNKKERSKVERCLTGVVGTTWYRSPETLLKIHYDTAPELWSFGCILYELFKYSTKDAD